MHLSTHGINIGLVTYIGGNVADVVINRRILSLIDSLRVSFNLLVIGPIFYNFIFHKLCRRNPFLKQVNAMETVALTFIHSILYKYFHSKMHTTFTGMHEYHHSFKEDILISTANAVSIPEFVFAYMMPFLIGSWIILPAHGSLNLSASIVSLFNFAVHCEYFYNFKWIPGFVPPKLHINHHRRTQPSTTAAPTFHI